MTPGIPQIDPVPFAAPAAVFWFLLILTFTLHLLPMSAVLGGSLIGLVARRQAARGSAPHAELARLMGKLMPVAISAAVTLGVAALLFVQVLYGRLFFSSSVVMAWFWVAVVPLLIVAYYSAYGVAFGPTGSSRLALAAVSAAIFLGIAFIYTNNMTLMLRPDAQHALYRDSAGGLALNAGDAMLWPRYVHMVVGAVSIAGLGVALIGMSRRHADAAFGRWAIEHGCRWFVVSTVVNFGVGVWFLAALPPGVLPLFLGRSAYATIVLALALLAALAAVGTAIVAGKSDLPARPLAAALGSTFITVVLMVLARDVVRQSQLDAIAFQTPARVEPQWGPIAIFAVLLVAAIAVVAWMIAVLVRSWSPAAVREPAAEVSLP